ncbi:hypothetical protein B0H12DRAFT_1077927 [Mycena haematopus]|nr:hypothetical protein B0H12DRAFT_1077927 [Mycena haematopus]
MAGRLDRRDKIGKRVVCVPQKGGVLGGSIGRETSRILDPNRGDVDFARRFKIAIESVRYDATTLPRNAHAIMVREPSQQNVAAKKGPKRASYGAQEPPPGTYLSAIHESSNLGLATLARGNFYPAASIIQVHPSNHWIQQIQPGESASNGILLSDIDEDMLIACMMFFYLDA